LALGDGCAWERVGGGIPRLRALPGFRAGYFFGDPAANTVHAIYLWDEKPVEELEDAMNDFRHRCRDLTIGPGRREDFEVLAEASSDAD
jgi:hypothetical protein